MSNENTNPSHYLFRHRFSKIQIHKIFSWDFKKEDLLAEKIEGLGHLNKIKGVLVQLKKSQIFFICFKGFALSHRLYRDPSVRKSKDLDIFLPNQGDVPKLRNFLLFNGWVPLEEWVDDLPRRDWYMGVKHDISFFNSDTGIILEIHWELDTHFLNLSEMDLEEFESQYVKKEVILNEEINVLRPEFELLYLLVHGAKHGWFRLKWLLDIHHYPFNLVDTEKFEKLVSKYEAEILIFQADKLLFKYFGTGFPIASKVKAPAYLIKYSIMRIEEEAWDSSPTLLQFFQTLRYDFLLQKDFFKAVKGVFFRLTIRPQDISKVKFDAYWKYFFYRYYSLIERKILKK